MHIISIQRRLGDHAFSNARTWPEMQQAHRTWWKHYNIEHHYAHRERQDGRHSPSAVLRGVLGRTSETEWLLALRRPHPAPRRSQGRIITLARQLPFPRMERDWMKDFLFCCA